MFGIPNTVLLATVGGLAVVLIGVGAYRKRAELQEALPAQQAYEAGDTVGRSVKRLVDGWLVGLGAFVYGVLKWVPKSGAIGDSLMTAGAKIKKKRGDVLLNVIYGDGVVVPRAATWQSEERVFETPNGEEFSARGIGFDPKRLNGKVPVVWALRAGSEVTEPLEAAIANARKLGRFQPFTRASGESDVAVDIDPNGYGYGPGVGRPGRGGGESAAVPDGGMVGQPGAVNQAVDAAHARAHGQAEPDYEGQIISFRDGFELFGSKVTQEDMKQQETRGKLAVLDWDRKDAIKTALLVLGGVVLGLFGPSLAAQIASGAGGVIEGGVSLPITILPGGLV